MTFWNNLKWYNKFIIIVGTSLYIILVLVVYAQAQQMIFLEENMFAEYTSIYEIEDQEARLNHNNKFVYLSRREIDGLDIEVHEYENPKGYKGIQIFDYTNNKSIGYGVEAESRTYLMPAIIDETSPTSTPPKL